jgi:hypothetical protein
MMGIIVSGLGALLAALALAGLAGSWDDAALEAAVAWIEQTNPYYDATRIWISAMVLAAFLIWAGRYLARYHPGLSGLSPVWPPVLLTASLAVSPVYVAAHKGWAFADLFVEDGFFEYLTVVLLALSAVLSVLAARGAVWSAGERRLLWLLAAGLIFLAAEEISWGQRILGIETPAALREVNVQGEINLHNLTVGWNEIVRMMLACALSAILILLPRDAVPGLRGRFMRLKPDGRFLGLIPLLILSHLYDEWFEQIVSFAILSYALLIWRRRNAGDAGAGVR